MMSEAEKPEVPHAGLIVEARALSVGSPRANLAAVVHLLADALDAQGDTVPQTDVDDATNEGIEWMHRAKRAEAERDALAHVMGLLLWSTDHVTGTVTLVNAAQVKAAAAAPDISLALHDAEVWRQGYDAGFERGVLVQGKQASGDAPANPYRAAAIRESAPE